jgi:hypothetical protein
MDTEIYKGHSNENCRTDIQCIYEKLMIILCQIIDQRLLATLSTHIAFLCSHYLKTVSFQDGDTLAIMHQGGDASCNPIFECTCNANLLTFICRMLAHSSDIAPCDYHMFWPLKDALRGYNFSSGEEIKMVVHE